MRIEVDRELCISVASCVAIAPNTFELDDQGIAIIKNPTGDDAKTILQSAQSCPVNAIRLFDDQNKQIHPPQ
jgi:ferredoxin